ncbi:serine/threonine protein kinase [Streptomyces kunmingensis]|uniref:non-specific serine/threonine protein kinase n=1 Tax=Streptomyces kunmingensis TaxID=68225 RepID=A0ABU6C5T5_9ACTN|nr:serine/threonine-protein kinase [Streptomyces kunmingensis]MEB3959869.1 serine/threonine protein kinase [Streptomyces kunmingensis]
MQGQLLAGRYRLGESIGRGGMGRVWSAHDEVLHRAVAVKELTAAQWVSEADRAILLARTQTEARAAARINHPAVVTVHDVLEHDDRPWIVMELVEGPSLADAVKEHGRIVPEEAARIGLWTLRALRAAHTAGVLHRDVKPGNVLLSKDGRVKLTDFGIAQVEGDSTITRTGEIVGSVDYLAPERVSGSEPGPASDLWGLGATLYTAIEGISPFRRTSPISTMQAVIEEEPEVPEYAGAMGPVISALLRKDPAARPTADEAEVMLAEAAEGRRSHAAQAYVPTQVVPAPGPTQTDTTVRPPAASVPAPADPKRRHWPRMLIAVVAALAIGGGGVVAAKYYMDYRSDGSGISSGQSTAGQDGSADTDKGTGKDEDGQEVASGAIPEDWVEVKDVEGFTLRLPPGWKRQANGQQIDYTPDGGESFVRIAIDKSSQWPDSYQHQLDLEKNLKVKLPDYQRVMLDSNTFRDRPGSLWEFTWTAGTQDATSGARHAIEETYRETDGTEYAIYLSVPAADWDGAREQFDAILRGWQPAS